jgi:hypothetical protein
MDVAKRNGKVVFTGVASMFNAPMLLRVKLIFQVDLFQTL